MSTVSGEFAVFSASPPSPLWSGCGESMNENPDSSLGGSGEMNPKADTSCPPASSPCVSPSSESPPGSGGGSTAAAVDNKQLTQQHGTFHECLVKQWRKSHFHTCRVYYTTHTTQCTTQTQMNGRSYQTHDWCLPYHIHTPQNYRTLWRQNRRGRGSRSTCNETKCRRFLVLLSFSFLS